MIGDQVLAVAVRVKKQREGRIATIGGVTKHALWVRLSKNSTQMTMYFVHLDKVLVFSKRDLGKYRLCYGKLYITNGEWKIR